MSWTGLSKAALVMQDMLSEYERYDTGFDFLFCYRYTHTHTHKSVRIIRIQNSMSCAPILLSLSFYWFIYQTLIYGVLNLWVRVTYVIKAG